MRSYVNACNCTLGCTDTESGLWEKNSLAAPGIEPALAACRSDALPTELHPHGYARCAVLSVLSIVSVLSVLSVLVNLKSPTRARTAILWGDINSNIIQNQTVRYAPDATGRTNLVVGDFSSWRFYWAALLSGQNDRRLNINYLTRSVLTVPLGNAQAGGRMREHSLCKVRD